MRPLFLHITAGDTSLIRNDNYITPDGEKPLSEVDKKSQKKNGLKSFLRGGRFRRKGNGVMTTFSVPEDTDVTTFDISQAPVSAEDTEKMLSVSMHRPFVNAPTQSLVVSIPGWGSHFSKPIPVISAFAKPATSSSADAPESEEPSVPAAAAAPLPFTVEYQCLKPGSHEVTVSLRLVPATPANVDKKDILKKASTAMMRTTGSTGFRHVSYTFTKVCGARAQSSRSHGVPGLRVGSSEKSPADVVSDGEALAMFRFDALPGDQGSDSLGPSNLFLVGEGVRAHTFYIEYRPPSGAARFVDLASASAVSHKPSVQTSVVGHAARRHRLSSVSSSSKLTVLLTCTSEEDAVVTVLINVQDSAAAPRFSFLKRCGPRDLAPDAAVGCEAGLCQVSVGSEAGLDDVVRAGVAAEAYLPADLEAGVKRVVVNSDEQASEFFLRVAAGTVDVDGVQVVASDPSVVRPILTDPFRWSMVRVGADAGPLPLRVEYECLGTGVSQVSLHLHSEEDLVLVWRKSCAGADTPASPTDPSLAPSLTPDSVLDEQALPGLAVALTTVPDSIAAIAVRHGLTLPNYQPHLAHLAPTPLVVDSATHFTSFFLIVMRPNNEEEASAYADVRFGAPLATSHSPIVDAHVYGPGANGGLLSPLDDTYSLLSVSLHCRARGSAWVTVSLPLLAASNDAYVPIADGMPQRPRAHRDSQHVSFSFRKECLLDAGARDDTPSMSTSALGGVGMPGLSVGTTRDGNEVVRDGLPTRTYFGQRKQSGADWERSVVPEAVYTTSLYLSYQIAGYERDDDDLLIPHAVRLGVPAVVAHTAGASPVLGGDAAAGAELVFRGPARELTITYNCNFMDVVPVTVSIPVEPAGTLIFTIPKRCHGREVRRGAAIPGLDVALRQETCIDLAQDLGAAVSDVPAEEPQFGEDDGMESTHSIMRGAQRCRQTLLRIVRDGAVDQDFSAMTAPSAPHYQVPSAQTVTTLYLRRAPKSRGKGPVTPLFGSEPLVQCLRPICRPEVSHRLALNTALLRGEPGQETYKGFAVPRAVMDVGASPVVIDEALRKLEIRLHCIVMGTSPVQVTIPLFPEGALTLSFLKVCSGESMGHVLELEGPDSHAGSTQGSWDRHDETSGFADPLLVNPFLSGPGGGGLRAADVYRSALAGWLDVGTAGRDVLTRTNVVLQGVPRQAYRAVADGLPDRETNYKGAAALRAAQAEAATGKSTGKGASGEQQGLLSLDWAQWRQWLSMAGPQRGGVTDTEDELLSEEDYALLSAVDPEGQYALVPPKQDSMRFLLSVHPDQPSFQPIARPFVKTLLNGMGQPIVRAKVSGPAANGGNITSVAIPKLPKKNAPVSPLKQLAPGEGWIDVEFKCLRQGYTAALVVVPLVPAALGSVSWRVIKLCGGVRAAKSRWMLLLQMGFFALLAVPLALVGIYQCIWGRAGRRLMKRMRRWFEQDQDSGAWMGTLRPTNRYAGLGSEDPDELEQTQNRGGKRVRFGEVASMTGSVQVGEVSEVEGELADLLDE